MFLGVPGLRVVAPSHLHRPGDQLEGLIRTTRGPVLFIEHKQLYAEPLVRELPGFRLHMVDECDNAPTAVVANYRGGQPDVSIITYGGATLRVLELMKRMMVEEIRVLAAVVSGLDPLPVETLAELAPSAERVLIVEEGTEGFNWGSEVASRLYERAWHRLRHPIRRIASLPRAIPCARHLEDEALITADRIEDEVMEVMLQTC